MLASRDDKPLSAGRRLAATGLALDVVGAGLALVLTPHRQAPVLLGAGLVVALGSAGVWRPRVGVALLLVRGPLALMLMIVALTNRLGFVAAGAVTAGAWLGLLGASRVRVVTAELAIRRDKLWSAALHLGALAAVVGVATLDSLGTGTSLGLLWVSVMWGGVGVHEFGHAFGALATGNEVKRVEIGLGLAFVKTRRVTVRAVPFVGYTEWEPAAFMTSRREAVMVAAGPAANLLCGMALSAAALIMGSSLVGIVAATQYFTFLINLVPFGHAHGPGLASDGQRLLRLVRPTPLPPPSATR